MARPTIICVTPVRNEGWILERFLRCASVWADHIVIADQGSTDGTAAIAKRFEKVTYVENTSAAFDEAHRQRLLLETARRFAGPRLILALDADEAFTADSFGSVDWRRMTEAAPGTVMYFHWVNVGPGFKEGWDLGIEFPWGFMDDGTAHSGRQIHTPRVPVPAGAPVMALKDVRVLHYQYANWRRMEAKTRWYQCWERLNFPGRLSAGIFRQYHHMTAIPARAKFPLREEWFKGYEERGINMKKIEEARWCWFDEEVLKWLVEFGPERLARVDIWGVDWEGAYREIFKAEPPRSLKDPRTAEWRENHKWLLETQGRAEEGEVLARVRAMEVEEMKEILPRAEAAAGKLYTEGDAKLKCPLCGEAAGRPVVRGEGEKSNWRIIACEACTSAWTEPAPGAIDYAVANFHASAITKKINPAEKENRKSARKTMADLPEQWRQAVMMQADLLSRHVPAGARVLEIGCGEGILLEELKRRGFDVTGVETSVTASAAARAAGLKVLTGSFPEATTGKHFGAVVMSQVLEHLPEPSKILRAIGEAAPGGKVLFVQTNYQGWMPRWHKEKWYAWVPEQHFWHFTPRGLAKLAGRLGWRVVETEYSSLVHETSRHARLALDMAEMGDQFHLLLQVPKEAA